MSTASRQVLIRPGAEAYAPEIRVTVAGQLLSDAVLQDVLDLRVTLQRDELSGFSMVLANVDLQKTELSREREITGFKYSDNDLLDIEKGILVEMGYAGALAPMMVGEITSVAPAFPESGLPTFSVTAVDRLQRFRRAKPGDGTAKEFRDKMDWQIVEAVAARHGLVLSPDSTREGPSYPIVQQKDQDDLDFVLQRAQLVGFECYVTVASVGGVKQEALFFGKPKDGGDSRKLDVLTYRWGESLRSFTPKLSIGKAVSKVTVRSWDPAKKDKIQYTAEAKDLPPTSGNGRTGAELVDKSGAKEERIVDHSVQTEAEAKAKAIGVLQRNANQFLTGTATAMGDPAIRPGVLVRLEGLGRRFRGDYKVTKADHSFGSGGYTTSFDVERDKEEEQPTSGVNR